MSHLLATVNPEAADNIRPIAPRQPLPGVGETVVYTMRPGFSRAGRSRFPALVMGEQGGKLLLTVIVDAGDMVDESLVEEAGPGHEFHCWERVQPTAVPGIHGTVAALHERIGALEAEFKQMSEVVLGEFEAPAVSIIHIMQDFENRLRDGKKSADELRDYLDPLMGLADKPAKAARARKSKK
jgi:hypothetical protein